MGRPKKTGGANSAALSMDRKGQRSAPATKEPPKRKTSPGLELLKKRQENSATRAKKRDIVDDTTTSSESEAVVVYRAAPSKRAKNSQKNMESSSEEEEKEQEENSDTMVGQKRKEVSERERLLEAENKKLRVKVSNLQKRSQELGSGTLNELMKTQLGRFVKETMFRKVKFVNNKKLDWDSRVMQQCMECIGIGEEKASEYGKEVRKYVKYFLTQRRNYVIQNLKTIVTSKCKKYTWGQSLVGLY